MSRTQAGTIGIEIPFAMFAIFGLVKLATG